jgi:hypothetical protein
MRRLDASAAAPEGAVITAGASELVLSGFFTTSRGAGYGFIAVPTTSG